MRAAPVVLAGAIATGAPPAKERFSFRNDTAASGIDFVHVTGATGKKYLIETMGAGIVVFDYDSDRDPDLFFVNSAAPGKLYRNDGSGRFEDRTAASGLVDEGYGMGAVAGDYDNDGDPDLYVTHYGANRLFRNQGDGTFVDVTAQAGVGNDLWSASATWADLDGDGDLDLYVTNYLDWSVQNHPDCSQRVGGEAIRAYCLPDPFRGLPDVLYENLGNGRFEDVSVEAGVARTDGKGLGVVAFDYDGDGLPDLYVANDTVPNFLFRNEGGMKFREVGLASGVAYDEEGNALAGMGVDAGDYDADGDLDLFVTNFEGEANTLYRNEANGFFTDVSFRAGIGRPSLRPLGFGAIFADLDNDSALDLVVANGHTLDNVERLREGSSYAQLNQLFASSGDGRFALADGVPGFDAAAVSRGLAAADLDSDGDLDLVFTSSGGPPELLSNETAAGNALRLLLVGRTSNRDAVGARIRVQAGSQELVFEVKSGSSYLSQSEAAVHVGLRDRKETESVSIRWSGRTEELGPLEGGRLHVVVEGAGVVASRNPE